MVRLRSSAKETGSFDASIEDGVTYRSDEDMDARHSRLMEAHVKGMSGELRRSEARELVLAGVGPLAVTYAELGQQEAQAS